MRLAATEELEKIGKSAVLKLTNALKDPNPGVRRRVVWALGMMRNPGAVNALIEIVLGDKDSFVRGEAAWALGKIEHPGAVKPLTNALKDPNPGVRWQVALALGEIKEKDPEAVDALIERLENDEEWHVRMWAAYALGKIGDERAVGALIQARKNDGPIVSLWATEALKKMGIDPENVQKTKIRGEGSCSGGGPPQHHPEFRDSSVIDFMRGRNTLSVQQGPCGTIVRRSKRLII